MKELREEADEKSKKIEDLQKEIGQLHEERWSILKDLVETITCNTEILLTSGEVEC